MKIIIATIIILSLFIGSFLFNATRIGMLSFGAGAKRLLEKSELLSKKAETFEEKKVLQKLGMNSLNGFCYRFDGHLEEAVFENKNSIREKAQKDLASFSFEVIFYPVASKLQGIIKLNLVCSADE